MSKVFIYCVETYFTLNRFGPNGIGTFPVYRNTMLEYPNVNVLNPVMHRPNTELVTLKKTPKNTSLMGGRRFHQIILKYRMISDSII
jgi:hypothetical protein